MNPADKSDTEVLRRKSFRALSWGFTLLFAAGGFAAMAFVPRDGGGPLIGSAACFGMVALARRIFGSSIVLGEQLKVVNPLVTHHVPYRDIREVASNSRGTLTVVTSSGRFIYSTGFGGSLIDHYVGTADRAAERINARRRRGGGSKAGVHERRALTRAWVADTCSVLAVLCAISAAVVGV
ncbi:hypothetical protein H9Y04_45440 [Streptomyces sp. TRM66268-LWL]|uniref:PH domain-containing protein n=1 Tax=Streptomyces polyasparticus TaxID=2767826 RepID=A0ABR7SW37_9ACTN|nr:hypothetical protein [Streptomyces polyasparticus]MBC9719722.1 hypothetical protein [Streptomyces polyasparticus]